MTQQPAAMELDEWCAAAHVDVMPGTRLEVAEDALRAWAAGGGTLAGVLDLLALKDERRPNHFEVVGRFASEASYRAHQTADSNLAFRWTVGSALGSPYEDRVLAPWGEQRWPVANVGDFVMITQVEARPDHVNEAAARFDAVLAELAGAEGLLGFVALQRRYLPNNLEALSVWSDAEACGAQAATRPVSSASAALEATLLAPIENRRFFVYSRACASD
jgi:quinol monooxygenase YgiN